MLVVEAGGGRRARAIRGSLRRWPRPLRGAPVHPGFQGVALVQSIFCIVHIGTCLAHLLIYEEISRNPICDQTTAPASRWEPWVFTANTIMFGKQGFLLLRYVLLKLLIYFTELKRVV